MAEKSKNTEEKKDREGLESLFAYTGAVRDFANTFKTEGVAVAKRLKQDQYALMLNSSSDFFVNHLDKLCSYVEDSGKKLSLNQRLEVNDMMKYGDGTHMAKTLTQIMIQGLQQGARSTFLQWINDNLEELKKLILQPLEFILEFFNLTIPNWVIDLINLIDELAHIALALLDELMGGDRESMTQRLHKSEIIFLREITEVKRYKQIKVVTEINEDSK